MSYIDRIKFGIVLLIFITGAMLSTTNAQVIHEKSFNVSPGQQIEVEADLGDVRIRTWSNDEVYVKITGNRKAADNIDFEFEQTSEGVFVKADKEGDGWFSWFKGMDLKFDIKVPEQFNAFIYTAGGDVDLMDLKGEVELKTSGGDIQVQRCTGNLNLKTSGGDIQCADIDGPVQMGTSGGDIETKNLYGNAQAKTSGGDIRLGVREGKVLASTSGGDVKLYYVGENKGIELKTSGGDIDVYVDDDFEADADLKTSGGDIRIKIEGTRTDMVSSSKYRGTINGGGALIECRTTGGDISIKKR